MSQAVLIVDDRKEVGAAIKTLLESEGYRAFFTANAIVDWNVILSQKPDILVIGIDTPNAFRLLQQVHSEPLRTHIITLNRIRSQKMDFPDAGAWHTDVDLHPKSTPADVLSFVKRIFKSIDEDDMLERD